MAHCFLLFSVVVLIKLDAVLNSIWWEKSLRSHSNIKDRRFFMLSEIIRDTTNTCLCRNER